MLNSIIIKTLTINAERIFDFDICKIECAILKDYTWDYYNIVCHR